MSEPSITSYICFGNVANGASTEIYFFPSSRRAQHSSAPRLISHTTTADLRERAKWNAWAALSGTSKGDAMRGYVELVAEVVGDTAPEAAADLNRQMTALSNGVESHSPVSSQPPSPSRSGLRVLVDPIAVVDVTAPINEGDLTCLLAYMCGNGPTTSHVRACVRACMCACVHACQRVYACL